MSLNFKNVQHVKIYTKDPQLKMSENCVKSYSSWNAFFFFLLPLLLVTQIIKGKQLYYKMWSSKSKILRIIDICVFLQQCWKLILKGEPPAQFFLERRSAMTRATFVIFWPKLSSFIDWCCYYTQVSYTGSWEPLVLCPRD